MRKPSIKIFLFFISVLSSCDQIWIEKDPVNSYENNFEILWKTMDERYSFFEFKNIDWTASYQTFKNQASQAKNDQEFFEILNQMLSELQDGHVNLRSSFDISRFQPYLDSPPNFNFDVLERNYLQNSRLTGHLLNHEIQGVGYIYYRSFTSPIANFEIDSIISRFKNLPGIIIDIRNNEGGNPANGLKILSRIISKRTNIYNSQFKNGPGRSEFTELEKVFLDPYEGPTFAGKIVVLTNRKVYSAASYFSAAIKNIDNAILMGDDTGGGSGVPAGFELPNGWYFNFSSSIGYTAQGLNFESGVPVDIKVELDPIDIQNNKDTILEAAISYIKN